MISFILAIITGIAVIAADQLTKLYVAANFTENISKKFIPYLIDLTYIHNGGGAWGMMSGKTALLLLITTVIMVICLVMLIKLGRDNKLLCWAICLVIGGGIGNMIDRIFRGGYVIDFLQFAFWKEFPVFNLADIAIVVGACLLVLYFIKSTVDEAREKRTAQEMRENDANGK